MMEIVKRSACVRSNDVVRSVYRFRLDLNAHSNSARQYGSQGCGAASRRPECARHRFSGL